ncbi:MAG TPA: LysR family transcriptional regulator [Pirellulales bacterium]|nr:LysR family transcriptional regulator [Pirellulales bacterium]
MINTDQVQAFVEVAARGSLRAAAAELHITEQGLRNRLLALERQLGAELYRKARGPRRTTPLTAAGDAFLPHAQTFLARGRELSQLFQPGHEIREVHVAASQYLLMYVLIDAVRRFHARRPNIRIRISTHSEQEIEHVLLNDPGVALGVAAPYEPAADLQYQHVFSMNWSLLAPLGHPLLKSKQVALAQLAEQPLIFFERGSTGRQHILEAFQEAGVPPRIQMETTTTEIIVRMVEAGLGLAIVPLLANGVVTRKKRVADRPLRERIRPINSGILTRRGEVLSPAAQEFVAFVRKGLAR